MEKTIMQIKKDLEGIKISKGEISYKDFDELIKPYNLNDEQINDLITWINLNDLNICLESEKLLGNPYYRAISIYPLLDREQEYQLAKKIVNGDLIAKDKFIKSNLRLVVEIAKKYTNDLIGINDLIQEGNIGLIKAVEKYDPDKNVGFYHYAYYWIRKSIIEAINKSQLIVVPQKIYQQLNKLKSVKESLQQILQTVPTNQQIADKLQISIERVEQLQSYQITMSSIEEDTHLIDMLNFEMDNPFLSERLYFLISKLPNRNQEILNYYFGLQNYQTLNTQQIATKLNLTKQRVGQIIKESLLYIKENYDK